MRLALLVTELLLFLWGRQSAGADVAGAISGLARRLAWPVSLYVGLACADWPGHAVPLGGAGSGCSS